MKSYQITGHLSVFEEIGVTRKDLWFTKARLNLDQRPYPAIVTILNKQGLILKTLLVRNLERELKRLIEIYGIETEFYFLLLIGLKEQKKYFGKTAEIALNIKSL